MEFGDTRVAKLLMSLECIIDKKKTREPSWKMIRDKLIKSMSSLTLQTNRLPLPQILKGAMARKE